MMVTLIHTSTSHPLPLTVGIVYNKLMYLWLAIFNLLFLSLLSLFLTFTHIFFTFTPSIKKSNPNLLVVTIEAKPLSHSQGNVQLWIILHQIIPSSHSRAMDLDKSNSRVYTSPPSSPHPTVESKHTCQLQD